MTDEPPKIPPLPSGPAALSGCLAALMAIIGIILLLPGLCAIIFGVMSISDKSFPSDMGPLLAVCLAIGFGGAMLIWAAIRMARSRS